MKLGKTAFALGIAAAGIWAAADRTLNRWAEQQVDRWLANAPVAASHGAVAYSWWHDRLDIADLAVDLPLPSAAATRAGVRPVAFAPPPTRRLRVRAEHLVWQGGRPTGLQLVADKPILPQLSQLDGLTITNLNVTDGASTVVRANSASIIGLKLPTRPPPPDSAPPQVWANYLQAVRLDHLDMTGVDIATTDNDTHFALGRLAIDKLSIKGINAIEVNNFNFSNREAQARLGALRLAGFTFALNNPPLKMPDAFLKEFRVADFAAGPRGGPEVALKEFALTMDGEMGAPTASELKLVDLRLPGDLAPPIREAGYGALNIGMSVLTAYDTQRHTLESKAQVSATDVGQLGYLLRLSGVPQTLGPMQGPEDLERLFGQMHLDRLEVRYQDASLVDRILKLEAQDANTDLESMRQQVVQSIETEAAANAGKPALANAMRAVARFLRRPGTLTLSAECGPAVTLADIGNAMDREPDSVPDLVSLKLE